MPSVLDCSPSGSRYGNVPNELIHRAGPPFLDNHYRGYQYRGCFVTFNQFVGLPYLPAEGMVVLESTRDEVGVGQNIIDVQATKTFPKYYVGRNGKRNQQKLHIQVCGSLKTQRNQGCQG